MRKESYALIILVTLIFSIPGCTEPYYSIEENPVEEKEDTIPEHMTIIADTANREIDRTDKMDVILDSNGSNTLIMWVSTGCSGCHDWTKEIAELMRNGTLDNDTRIITIHRYPAFESKDEVIEVYASENSSTESLWPVLMPYDGQCVFDLDTGKLTDINYVDAFDNPATPSLTIIDGDGSIIWYNQTYWYNQSTLEHAISILNN